MHSLWVKAAIFVGAIWLVAASVIFFARNSKPTPESLATYVKSQPLDRKPQAERVKAVKKVADALNSFSFEQRREARMGHELAIFFRSLTPEEQSQFLDLTLPTGFKQMMAAFNNMNPAKRKRFVETALTRMKEREDETPPLPDNAQVQKIIGQGLSAFYSEASAEVKMDLAPLIEQMQQNLQGR